MLHVFHPRPQIRSERARRVAALFGLRRSAPAQATHTTARATDLRAILPQPGCITLITGPSGSGKSSLLRALRQTVDEGSSHGRANWIDLNYAALPEAPLVDCFDGIALHDALSLLGRVGLGEAWTYLRTPSELSDGQRWRLKLALALQRIPREAASGGSAHADRVIFGADEFAALLDRVTAMVVARALRRAIVAPLSAVVATSHDDLVAALEPDRVTRCDYGRIELAPYPITRPS